MISEKPESPFDAYARDYKDTLSKQHRIYDSDSAYFQKYKVELTNALIGKKRRILDFGCGVGLLLGDIKTIYPNAEITAADISKASLEYVRMRHPEVYAMDCENALMKEYDLIIVSCVLHHVEKDARPSLLKRLFNALSPSGSIIFFEHNPLNPITKHIVNTCIFDEDAILLRRSELVNLIKCHVPECLVVSGYTLFFPGPLKSLRWLERYLRWLPAGGQYYVMSKK